jgi:hypothetical protein
MSAPEFNITTHERIWLKSHPTLNEAWVQEAIADDAAILGLGPLNLIDKERRQPGAGRLDLLLQDDDGTRRFEVEIQLGRTDERHLVRTIEYWDIERRRYPGYEHCAVIVAEDITSRFLNVMSLFSGQIPLIAIQMSLLRIGNQASLVFTKVLDEQVLRIDDSPPTADDTFDRQFWERKASTESVATADKMLELAREIEPTASIRYGKSRIVIATGSQKRIALLTPQKRGLKLGLTIPQNDEVDQIIEDSAFDLDYLAKVQRYRLVIGPNDVAENREVLLSLLSRVGAEQFL